MTLSIELLIFIPYVPYDGGSDRTWTRDGDNTNRV